MAHFHIELRQFPRNYTRFNLTPPEIGTIAMTWAQERMLTLDDQKWSPAEATIIIIEGPAIPIERLSMGRGWPTALREGEVVTDKIIDEARAALRESITAAAASASAVPNGVPSPAGGDALALGVELGGLLGPAGGPAAGGLEGRRGSKLGPYSQREPRRGRTRPRGRRRAGGLTRR